MDKKIIIEVEEGNLDIKIKGCSKLEAIGLLEVTSSTFKNEYEETGEEQ